MENIDYNEDRYSLGCEALKLAGYKITPCRRFVLATLHNSKQSFSVKNLLELSGEESEIDQSTLYRTLEIFVDLDILETVKITGNRQVHYRWKHHAFHSHAVCKKCGNIEHSVIYPYAEMIQRIADVTGYSEIKFNIDIQGLCLKCIDK